MILSNEIKKIPYLKLQHGCFKAIAMNIHFRARFTHGEDRRGSSPRTTRNTSRSTAISGSSADSTPRREQARSEL